jgi:hypothetical protein
LVSPRSNSIDVACMQFRLAKLQSGLSGFPHLTTLVFEQPASIPNQVGWTMASERVLSLATGLMNANPTLKRVAFELHGSWANEKWPCYIRAQTRSDSNGDSTAVFEGFNILGPDSWREVSN